MSANCVCPSSVSSVAAEIEEKEKKKNTHTHRNPAATPCEV